MHSLLDSSQLAAGILNIVYHWRAGVPVDLPAGDTAEYASAGMQEKAMAQESPRSNGGRMS